MAYEVVCEDCDLAETVDTHAEAMRITREHRWTAYHDVDWH